MRDLHANKSVAMHIGLINFQYVLQQGMNYYFGEAPYVLTDGYRTERTNASIENAAKKSQHLEAAASDGRFEKASIEQQFKLASWFDVGGVGIYPHHVHIDAGRRRRWAGGYHTNGQTEMINTFFVRLHHLSRCFKTRLVISGSLPRRLTISASFDPSA
jgi:hypothetical protein